MTRPVKNLMGKKFGHLTVISHSVKPENTTLEGAWWIVKCSLCGSVTPIASSVLRRRKDCGCAEKKRQEIRDGMVDFLIKNYEIKGVDWCAKKANLTPQYITRMANDLGLKTKRKNAKRDNPKPRAKKATTPQGHIELKRTPTFKNDYAKTWGIPAKPLNHGGAYKC